MAKSYEGPYPSSSISNTDYDQMDSDNKERQADIDADTLQHHSSLLNHSKRHAAAHAALQTKASNANDAMKNSSKHLQKKVKAGLKKAFPSSTPYNDAGKNSTSGESDVD